MAMFANNKIYNMAKEVFEGVLSMEEMVIAACIAYGLPIVEFQIVDSLPSGDDGLYTYHGGKFGTGLIQVVRYDSIGYMLTTVCHEFRHHWQWHNYYDLCAWWNNHRYGKDNLYNQAYWTIIHAIEEDARKFGYSCGAKNREDLLNQFSVGLMEALLSTGYIQNILTSQAYRSEYEGAIFRW